MLTSSLRMIDNWLHNLSKSWWLSSSNWWSVWRNRLVQRHGWLDTNSERWTKKKFKFRNDENRWIRTYSTEFSRDWARSRWKWEAVCEKSTKCRRLLGQHFLWISWPFGAILWPVDVHCLDSLSHFVQDLEANWSFHWKNGNLPANNSKFKIKHSKSKLELSLGKCWTTSNLIKVILIETAVLWGCPALS